MTDTVISEDGIFDIPLHRGNNWTITIQIGDPPADLTGWTFKLVAKWGRNRQRLTSSPAAGITILTPATDGFVELKWTPTQARALPPGRIAQYELEATNAEGQRTYLAGYINAEGGINDDA